jgi:hypothetical protein
VWKRTQRQAVSAIGCEFMRCFGRRRVLRSGLALFEGFRITSEFLVSDPKLADTFTAPMPSAPQARD